MKPTTGDSEAIASVTTTLDVRAPGSSDVTRTFSTAKGFEIARTGGIIRIAKGGKQTAVPLSNVISYEPA